MSTLEESIQIPVDGVDIAGTFVTPGTLVPGVLFVHGWGGCQSQYLSRARDVAALGSVCLTFDLRGHALTKRQFETVSRANNLQDVLTAYDTLVRRRHVDPAAIAVVGSSYGGYLSAILTTLRPVKWLALRVPALYMDRDWEMPKRQLHKDQDLDSYRKSLISAKDNRALRAAAAFEGDLMIETGESTRSDDYRQIARKLPGIEQIFPDPANVSPGVRASTIEFVLEGLHLHKLLNKYENSGFATYTR